MTHGQAGIWAAVPVKRLETCKQRLAAVLSPTQRADLVLAMLADVLAALSHCPALAGTLVISTDPAVLRAAASQGAEPLRQPHETGFAAAADEAAAWLAARPAVAGVMVVPADLPTATTNDFAEILAAHPSTPGCTLVPSWDGAGSNAVLLSPPTAMNFQFGPDSRRRHAALAVAAGLHLRVHANPNIAADIDTPDDLFRLHAATPGRHTAAFLRQSPRLTLPAAHRVPA